MGIDFSSVRFRNGITLLGHDRHHPFDVYYNRSGSGDAQSCFLSGLQDTFPLTIEGQDAWTLILIQGYQTVLAYVYFAVKPPRNGCVDDLA